MILRGRYIESRVHRTATGDPDGALRASQDRVCVKQRMDRLKRIAPFLKPLLILALFAVALRVLQDTLAHYRYRDVIRYLDALPIDQILLAAALTLLGYLVMTGYDTLAFRYIRHPLPYFKIALASFIGYAFNNNVGLSGLVGGSLRYRLYNAWRLTAVEIAKVIAFCTVSFWLGFVLLGGIFFLDAPPDIPPSIHMPFASIRLLGIVLLLPAIALHALDRHPPRAGAHQAVGVRAAVGRTLRGAGGDVVPRLDHRRRRCSTSCCPTRCR